MVGCCREATDQERRDSHDKQRANERAFTPDAVAEVPEEDGTDRARDEGNAEDRKGCEKRGHVVVAREIERGEYQ